MEIKSSAFEAGEMIPGKYTCDGQDISPPLEWSDFPDTVKSFAIISDDPDAPVGTWVHWVYYDIPADTTNLPENIPRGSVSTSLLLSTLYPTLRWVKNITFDSYPLLYS